MLLTIYVACAVIGGGMMLLSALGGFFHGGVEVDHAPSIEADHSIDFQHDLSSTGAEAPNVEVGPSLDVEFGGHDFWLAFWSMRFLMYFAGVFGIFGTALTLFSRWSAGTVLFVSVLMGTLIGYGGALLVRYLKAEGETSGVTSRDYIGALGSATVGIKASQPGKVRVSIKGDILDLIALSEGDKEIAKGEEIVVVGLEGDKVRVAHKSDYLD